MGAAFGLMKGMLICGVVGLAVLNYGSVWASLQRAIGSAPVAMLTVRCVRALWSGVPGY